MARDRMPVPFGYAMESDGSLVPESSEQAILGTLNELLDAGFTRSEIAGELVKLCKTKIFFRELAAEVDHSKV